LRINLQSRGEVSALDRILGWSSYLTAEEKLHYEVMNVDFIMMDYYWAPEFKSFVEELSDDPPSLIFLVGLQGSGKTSALKAIEAKLSSAYYWRWDGKLPELWEEVKHWRFFLVDLPDFRAGSMSRMAKDLDGIDKLWYSMRFGENYGRKHLIVAVQKEMFRGHYLFGKGEVFKLRLLTPEEFMRFYRRKFSVSYPFDDDSLMMVAQLSRGIFRRFIRYVRLTLLDMKGRGVESIDVDDVRRVISLDVIAGDMDLELSGFLRGSEKGFAVAAISALMEGGGMNQKDLALRLGVSETVMSRLMVKMEGLGYIERVRGDRKELRISLVNDS
jgi:hypothetical protein